MGRLLILVLIVLLAAWWLYGRATRLRDKQAQRPKPGDKAAPPAAVQDMVACAHCGVHLPRDEAVLDGARSYCGQPHRLLGPRE